MHIEKYKAGQVSGLIVHDERTCDNHSNEKIDLAKSHLNYNFIQEDSQQRYNQIMSEVSCLKRADINTLVGIAITLPDKIPGERSNEFFQNCFNFLADRYGKQGNIVSAWVHKDESTDHLHFKFVPVYWNEKKQQRAVSFDKVMPRKEYQSIHKDLEKFIHQKMDIEQAILNGATANGNKTITELKIESLKEEKNQLENQVKVIESKLDEFISEAERITIKKTRKLPQPDTKKIPFIQEEYVKKSQYDQLAKNFNKVNEEKIILVNANQALEAKYKGLERENKALGALVSSRELIALKGENKRLQSDLAWHEKFYQVVLQGLQEIAPNALQWILNVLPDSQRKKVQRDLKLQPDKQKELSR